MKKIKKSKTKNLTLLFFVNIYIIKKIDYATDRTF